METYLLAKRQESSIEQAETNSFSYQNFHFSDDSAELFYFTLKLDSEVKNYKGRVYGIIDAIGTLGGAFEIILWIIILLYGSIRKNLYLFYTINSLVQSRHPQNNESSGKDEHDDNNMIARSRRNQQFNHIRLRLGRPKTHIPTLNRHPNTLVSKNMF